jgi:hypothetical protein
LWRIEDPSGTWTQVGLVNSSGVGSPAVASWDGGRLDIFVHGGSPMTNALFQRTYFSDGSSTNWVPLGGVFTSSPAAAADPDAQGLDVLGLSADNAADPSRADGVWWKRWRP